MSSFGIFLLITFIVLPIIISLIFIRKIWKRNRQDVFVLSISILITAGLIYLLEQAVLSSYETIQVLLTATLILVTADYAIHTKKMAEEMKTQADANVKMAEEMREQRIQESRPTIIQRAVHKEKIEDEIDVLTSEPFSHFEIYNAGNGPAIEIEVSIVDKNGESWDARRITFLKPHDEPEVFRVNFTAGDIYKANNKYYLVSEYRGISSGAAQETWYQTWLSLLDISPSSTKGEVLVTCGQLKFKEVTEKDRINAFRHVRQMEEKP
jgi:hypothetical protein